jgi:hypothetical protein
MVPDNSQAPSIFSIMSMLVLAQCISSLFASASDYVGGLGKRVVFMFVCGILQIPVVWAGCIAGGPIGAVASIVGCYSAMICGYVCIAKRSFFGKETFHLPKDVPIAVILTIAAVLASTAIGNLIPEIGDLKRILMTVSLYTLGLFLSFASFPTLRTVYGTFKFLDLRQ